MLRLPLPRGRAMMATKAGALWLVFLALMTHGVTAGVSALDDAAPVLLDDGSSPSQQPQQQQQQQPRPQDPPDPSNGAFPGGLPTKSLDVPISAVFLVLFTLGALTHMTTYRINSKRGHKFLLSDLVFDFCMVRILTCAFRIAWAFTQVRIVVLLAAIFENGGAVVLFAVNLFLGQRLVRAMHPSVGWHPVFNTLSLALMLSVPATIGMNIVALAIGFYTTGFVLEIVTVAAYAFFRFDLLFHIPDGANRPGDYAMSSAAAGKDPPSRRWTAEEMQGEMGNFWMRYERLGSARNSFETMSQWRPMSSWHGDSRHLHSRDKDTVALLADERESGVLPPARARLNRR